MRTHEEITKMRLAALKVLNYGSVKLPDNWKEEARKTKALLLKEDLAVGQYYYGMCRNSSLAMWDGKEFVYMRTKFNDRFPETIKHPEDDDGFDYFTPLFQVTEISDKDRINDEY